MLREQTFARKYSISWRKSYGVRTEANLFSAREPLRSRKVALTAGARGAIISAMDLIKNILFFVALTAIICAIMLFEIRSERRRFFEPAPSSPRLHQS